MLLYVAGPYSAVTEYEQRENVKEAYTVALALWKHGHYAICPHTNTCGMELRGVSWKQAMKGYKEILSRCDGVVFLPKWRYSKGSKIEHSLAIKLGIKVYYWPDYPLNTKG